MLQTLDEDLGDAISATSESEPSPSNTNQAGQDIDGAVDIATLLEESDPHEQDRDFLDVDDLLNDSITADPSPEKALDLESVMGEFSGAQGDVDHIDVDSDDGFGAKLDLAHAYIEIGETESATELLEEIIENGHPPQSDEAKRVLASLSRRPAMTGSKKLTGTDRRRDVVVSTRLNVVKKRLYLIHQQKIS